MNYKEILLWLIKQYYHQIILPHRVVVKLDGEDFDFRYVRYVKFGTQEFVDRKNYAETSYDPKRHICIIALNSEWMQDLSMLEVEDIIAHGKYKIVSFYHKFCVLELIHVFQYSTHLHDSTDHGKYFASEARRISAQRGRSIQIEFNFGISHTHTSTRKVKSP